MINCFEDGEHKRGLCRKRQIRSDNTMIPKPMTFVDITPDSRQQKINKIKESWYHWLAGSPRREKKQKDVKKSKVTVEMAPHSSSKMLLGCDQMLSSRLVRRHSNTPLCPQWILSFNYVYWALGPMPV